VRSMLLLLLVMGILPGVAKADEQLTLASTTSTENSGLLGWLLPKFKADSGIGVRVVAVGTGQALRIARNGDADVLMTHARAREDAFVADGWGAARHQLMYNDFVVVGPGTDPAGVAGTKTAAAAFSRIARAQHPFASRGDESGTHSRELTIWDMLGTAPGTKEAWYREMGAGMGATLNAAVAMEAYTLTDRATWLGFGNRGNLKVLVQGDPVLFNQYAVILVNPIIHRHVRAKAGKTLIAWLLGPVGQRWIAEYRLRGQQVFFPNAGSSK
jgi:tungstate transport system substrate-binding protein